METMDKKIIVAVSAFVIFVDKSTKGQVVKYRELYTRGRLNIVAICVLKLQCHTASEEIILAKISWYVYLVLFNYFIYNSGNPGPVHISFLSLIMHCKIITAW